MSTAKQVRAKTRKTTLTDIDVIYKEKRLDGGVDHYIKVLLSDERVVYTSIRLHDKHAISCYENNDEIIWITLDKKRTLKATCRLFFKTYRKLMFGEKLNLFHILNKDDRKERKLSKLKKRSWRVHEVVFFKDGFFVARLSCSKLEKDELTDNQFILYPAAFQSLSNPDRNTRYNVYASHGAFTSTFNVNAFDILNAFRHERHWPQLSEALCEIEYAYKTEAEARAGLQYVINKQATPPIERQKFTCRNSVRQHSIDKSLTVTVCDEYKRQNGLSWLIKSEDTYYIAKMSDTVTDKIELQDSGASTAFTTIEDSALALVSQHVKKGGRTNDAGAIKDKWKSLIDSDLNLRLFSRNLSANWVVTDVLEKGGKCYALRAICLPEHSLNLPVQFQAHSYHILYIDERTNQLIDAQDENRSFYFGNITTDEFSQLLHDLINSSVNTEQHLYKKLVDVLRYSRGFIFEQDANIAWSTIQKDHINHQINGGVCAIKNELRIASFETFLDKSRTKYSERISQHKDSAALLSDYDKKVITSTQYPKALIDLAVLKGWCNSSDALKINKTENNYRYDLIVDLFKVESKNTEDSIINNSRFTVENTTKESKIKTLKTPISTTLKSNAGRKRIYKDEKERKRIWAKKNRDKKRQQLIENGVKPRQPGREKKHDNAAEKQAAYRFRKKWMQLSRNSALIFIDFSNKVLDKNIVDNISRLIPHFNDDDNNRLLSISPNLKDRNKNEVFSNVFTEKNNYEISSQEDYIKIKESLKGIHIKSVFICGSSITDHCYRLAVYLHELGYEPCLIKNCLHADSGWEFDVGLKLFKEKSGLNII